MDTVHLCPTCHQQIDSTDYFCRNCGKNLRPVPLKTDLLTLLVYGIGSVVVAPLGLVWGLRYLRGQTVKERVAGILLILLTLTTIAVVAVFLTRFMANVNEEVSRQLNGVYGAY